MYVRHEGVVILTLSYGCETLVWQEYEKSRVRAVEIYVLRCVGGELKGLCLLKSLKGVV